MSYSPRPDGLFDVTLDDGTTLPMALSEQQLQAAGHLPAILPPAPMPQQGPDMRVAGPGGGADAGWGALNPEIAGSNAALQDDADRQRLAAESQGRNPEPEPPLSPLANVFGPESASGGGAGNTAERKRAQLAKTTATSASENPSNLRRIQLPGAGAAARPSAGARPMRIPGGDTRASFTRVPGQEVSDAVRNDMLDDTRPEDLTLSADRIATMRDELQQQREAALLEQQKVLDQQKAQRALIDSKLQKLSDTIDKRDTEAERLKPQTAREIWADKGVFGQIAAAITIGLGGYNQGAGFTRDNEGLKLINESIRQDIDDQKARYEAAREHKRDAVNDYTRALQIYGSPEAASLDMQMRRLALVEKQIQARAEQIGTQEYLQKANAMATELRQQRAQTRQRLEELENGRIVQEMWVNVPDRYVGGAGVPKEKDIHQLSEDTEKAGIGEKEGELGNVRDQIAQLPEGDLPTVDTRNVLSRGLRAATDFVGGKGTAARSFDSDAERKAVQGVERIKGKLRHELSGVAVRPTEQEMLDRQLQDINTRDGLERFAMDLQRRIERRKAGIRAGVPPEAVQEYERRKNAYDLPQRPSSSTVDE